MLKAREAVRNLTTYHPPLGNREGLRLDFNENTVGCSPRVLQELRELMAKSSARYPEREPVEGLVADYLGDRRGGIAADQRHRRGHPSDL